MIETIKSIFSVLIEYPTLAFMIFVLIIIDIFSIVGLKKAEDQNSNLLFLISFIIFILSTFAIPSVYILSILAIGLVN